MTYLMEKPFEIVSYEQKEGKENNPRLYDLTSVQVDANKKFGFTADETLKTVQSLYEKKLVTYPRVDTTYLTEDLHPWVQVFGQIGRIYPWISNQLFFIEALNGFKCLICCESKFFIRIYLD